MKVNELMKANELMLGDWVLDTYTNKPMRIEIISRDMGEGLEPIPLTPEILEKNGWRAIWGWWSINACPFWLVKYTEKSWGGGQWAVRFSGSDDDDSFLISTVHELQHALRLCGISKQIEL